MSKTIEVTTIKKAFTENFREASYAILNGTQNERIPALAMYAAFKAGYLEGVKVNVQA